ncbi:hypothetical protein V6N13_042993 [Hibiscus sabdariffa]
MQVGEKETSQDSADVNDEVVSDVDDEVEGIKRKIDVGEGEDNNDVECEGQPNVGNDLVEEDEDIPTT